MARNRYEIYGGKIAEDEFLVQLTRGPTQFTISIQPAVIKNTEFGQKYAKATKDRHEYLLGIVEHQWPVEGLSQILDPWHLVCHLCVPLMQELEPRTSIQGLTVEDLCTSTAYELEVVVAEDSKDVRVRATDKVHSVPVHSLAPVPTASLPDLCCQLPRTPAKELVLATWDKEINPNDAEGVQGKVKTADGGSFYFKPRFLGREREFERELSILCQILDLGLHGGDVRLSKLVGLVVTGNEGQEAVGMLLEYIEPSLLGRHLLSKGVWSRPDLHRKWEDQILQTVRKLHSNGIIWGDVNPCNIAIDEELNATVIDFGGMNNVEFVDDDKRETTEGDWQGLSRIFKEWLPKRYLESQNASEGSLNEP
ncbi:hypothetical protein B9Z65_4906 [Elsinoe australis]|uniref:Protein kinase domain-containing protein n=1 Tax=Elsinoe australis TaxID=40998 RepID=A0A2P8A6E9_9PEZI|nr:hypothetical protein B9Z65_4906 [Elsinoe australis]